MCSTDVYCSKQTGSSSTKGNHHPSFLRFYELGEETVDAAKICGGAENVVKTETQQTFVNGLLGFITLGIYTPLESACVLLTIIAWVAHRYGQLYLLLINILLGSFSLFLHSDQPLSEGEIIPFSGVCQSGGGCIIHAGGGGGFTHWRQTALMCNRRRPAASSQSIIFSFSINNSFVYFASSAATSRWHLHVSNCRVRQLQFSGIFVALGFVGNGVITVMINGPWQADDDADNQAE